MFCKVNLMKSLYIYLVLTAILLNGCVSKRRYIQLVNNSKHNESLFRDTLKEKDFIINKLSIYINNMSSNGEIPAESFLPIIPNPPPQPTDYLAFNDKKFAKLKSYGQ